MKNLIPLLILMAVSICFLPSCNKDDDGGGGVGCGANWNASVELQDELADLNAAATAFGTDPTTENCISYRAAAQAYLDEIVTLESCYIAVGQQAEFNAAVESAQMGIDAIQC